MPYKTARGDFEKARRLGHVPIVESAFVRAKLAKYRVFGTQSDVEFRDDLTVPADEIHRQQATPRWTISFDGSLNEVATREEYPSTRVGYIQVAGVLVHLDELLSQSRERLVDPAAVKAATSQSLISVVLPSSNVCRDDQDTVRDSWRAEIFDLFDEYEIEDVPLLDVLIEVLASGARATPSGEVMLEQCSATKLCEGKNIAVSRDGASCPSCGRHLYPTDILRIHEEVSELNSNATALGRLMNVLEHVSLMCYLSFLFHRQPRILGNVAFVLDGPLATFGPPAPIKRSFQAYLRHIAHQLEQSNLALPVVFGVEKSGHFAEHAQEIVKFLPTRTLMRLPDDYIFQRVITSRAETVSSYGEDTYYGRKFFYKSASDQMLTITVPAYDESKLAATSSDDPAAYATLSATLALLDEIGTKLYEDGLIPVALAHSYASIPLRTGSKVLTLLSRELLGQ